MRYNNLTKALFILIVSFMFTACDEGMVITEPFVDIVMCDDVNNDDFTPLLDGDIVENEVSGTTVTIRDNEDGTRDICVNSGAAHIRR